MPGLVEIRRFFYRHVYERGRGVIPPINVGRESVPKPRYSFREVLEMHGSPAFDLLSPAVQDRISAVNTLVKICNLDPAEEANYLRDNPSPDAITGYILGVLMVDFLHEGFFRKITVEAEKVAVGKSLSVIAEDPELDRLLDKSWADRWRDINKDYNNPSPAQERRHWFSRLTFLESLANPTRTRRSREH